MKTIVILSFFLGIIPDLIICFIIIKILNEEWETFLFIYLGIQIVRLLRWVYIILADSIFYRLKWKEEIKKGIYSDLVNKNFPNPKSYEYLLTETYFSNVANDSDAECDTRLMAKEIVTTIESVRNFKGHQAYLQWEKSAELALSEYSKNFA